MQHTLTLLLTLWHQLVNRPRRDERGSIVEWVGLAFVAIVVLLAFRSQLSTFMGNFISWVERQTSGSS